MRLHEILKKFEFRPFILFRIWILLKVAWCHPEYQVLTNGNKSMHNRETCLRFLCLYLSSFIILYSLLYRLSQKKLQPAFGYRLQKIPLWNQKNQTGLWNYDYFPTFQWRPHLIWPNNHKEIWMFVKQVTGPFFPSFVTWMYMNVCGFHRQIVFTKDRLSNIFKFHAYLSNKGCSWQPKPCQICKIM